MQVPTQRFIEAVLLMTEREVEGSPKKTLWCPERHGKYLTRLISQRGKGLSGLLHQTVRLMRILSLASPRGGPAAFLYGRIPALRERYFEHEVVGAINAGRLTGFAVATHEAQNSTGPKGSEKIVRGVRLLETAMEIEGRPFHLEFRQMILPAALIDILYYTLGGELEKICSPILGPICTSSAGSVYRTLRSAFERELDGIVPADHAFRQARLIGTFLEAYFGERERTSNVAQDSELATATRAELAARIDNKTIVDFWDWQFSCEEPVDGFRLYRSAGRKLLAFRDSGLADSTGRRIENALSLTSKSDQEDPAQDSRELDIDRDELAALDEVNLWISPLGILLEEPASQIKWLKSKDDKKLLSCLLSASRAEDEEDSCSHYDDGDCLFGYQKPAEALALTLVRYICFGDWQNKITKSSGAGALDAEPAQGCYGEAATELSRIAQDLRSAVLAVCWQLRDTDVLASLAIMRELKPDELDNLFSSSPAIEGVTAIHDTREALARRFRAWIEQPDSQIGNEMRSAFGSINRQGIGKKSAGDQSYSAGLIAGAPAAIDLATQLMRISAWLSNVEVLSAETADRDFFRSHFQRLYSREASRSFS